MTPEDLARVNKAKQLAKERELAQGIIGQYAQTWQKMKGDVDALTAKIKSARDAGTPVDRTWLVKQHELEAIQGTIEAEMKTAVSYMRKEITAAQVDAVLDGKVSAEELIRASLGDPPPGTGWQPSPSAAATRQLVGYSADGKPLGLLLSELGPDAGRQVRRALVAGVAQGQNPRVIARSARSALGGNAARALTIARTEVLRSYRESSRAVYQANQDVVTGWVWSATLDANTCAVCWEMNGQISDTEQSMDTHPNCRCASVPQTKTWEELGFPGTDETQVSIEPGAEVFARQPESLQRRVLGPGKYEAYRDGKITLADLVQKTHSKQWGAGRREASLQTALERAGDQAEGS